MPHKDLTAAIAAGALSGLSFMLIFGLGLGFVFMFLPTVPLLFLGLSAPPPQSRIATGIAALLIALLTGLPAALMFLLFLALPALYISRDSLKWREHDGHREWFPLGLIILHLTLYACIPLAAVTLYYYNTDGGLPALIAKSIHASFADLQEQYGDVIDAMAGSMSFMIFPITIWMWGMMLYAHAWLANRILGKAGRQLRHDYTIQPFILPAWLLWLLAICALASLIGSPSVAFLGRAAMISLLLPYFFAGASALHESSKNWSNARFFLFFIYLIVFTLLWPALIISGIGLWQQIKRLSAAASSIRN
jgi:hypothetical protein